MGGRWDQALAMPGRSERSLVSRPGLEGLALEALPEHGPNPGSGGDAPYGAIDKIIVAEGTESRARHVTNGHRPTASAAGMAAGPGNRQQKGARWAPGKGCGGPSDQLSDLRRCLRGAAASA